jgi:hypothetical protein
MKQDDVINIYKLIGRFPGYEDIPSLVENILHINPDPKSLVKFSLHLLPDAEEHGRRELYFSQPKDKDIAQLNMDPALTDPHSLQPHKKELISDLAFKLKTDEYRPYGTAFGVPISTDQSNIDLEEEADILLPRVRQSVHGIRIKLTRQVKYGVKYPVHYILDEKEWGEKTASLYTLQIGGDKSSNRFLYGEHDKAANVMVEFVGEKKNTPVKDYTTFGLQFSYILQDATIPNVSNFRFKDIDDMDKPELETLRQKIIDDLPPAPQKPPWPVIPTFVAKSAREYFPPDYRNSLLELWDLQRLDQKKHKDRVDRLEADYRRKEQIYKKEKEEHDRKVQVILKESSENEKKKL